MSKSGIKGGIKRLDSWLIDWPEVQGTRWLFPVLRNSAQTFNIDNNDILWNSFTADGYLPGFEAVWSEGTIDKRSWMN